MSDLITMTRDGKPVAVIPEHMLVTLLDFGGSTLDGMDGEELDAFEMTADEASSLFVTAQSVIQSLHESHS